MSSLNVPVAQIALKCGEVAMMSGSQRDKDDWETRADSLFKFVMGKATDSKIVAPTGKGKAENAG